MGAEIYPGDKAKVKGGKIVPVIQYKEYQKIFAENLGCDAKISMAMMTILHQNGTATEIPYTITKHGKIKLQKHKRRSSTLEFYVGGKGKPYDFFSRPIIDIKIGKCPKKKK